MPKIKNQSNILNKQSYLKPYKDANCRWIQAAPEKAQLSSVIMFCLNRILGLHFFQPVFMKICLST